MRVVTLTPTTCGPALHFRTRARDLADVVAEARRRLIDEGVRRPHRLEVDGQVLGVIAAARSS